MGIFFVLYFYLALVAVLSMMAKDKISRRKLQVAGSAFGMWLVLALRSPLCGVDLYNDTPGSVSYYYVFKNALESSFFDILNGELILRSGMDVGWVIYTKVVTLITSDFQVFLAITAFIELFFLSRVIYKHSTHIFISFLVFFSLGIYLASFSTLRQVLALSITAYSIDFLLDKKYLRFSLWVILATTLHLSAIVFFVMIPLSKLRLTNKVCISLLILLGLLLPFIKYIITAITQILFGGARFTVETDEGGAYTMFVVYVLIFLLSLMIKNTSPYKNILRGIYLMSAAGQSLGIISTTHLTRVAFYFSIFYVFAFPMLIDRLFDMKAKKVAEIILSFLLFGFFYITAKDGYLHVVPYFFVWESNV